MTTSIAHIHFFNNSIIKTHHYTINITSTKAKLFVIKCGINQATQIANINYIVVIMDLLHAAQRLFDSFNNEFFSRNRFIDMFSSYFLFYLSDRKSAETRKTHLCKLDKIVFNTSTDSIIAIVISDISIKNQVTTSIAHVHVHNSPVIKTIYHAKHYIY